MFRPIISRIVSPLPGSPVPFACHMCRKFYYKNSRYSVARCPKCGSIMVKVPIMH
ncbi:MAG: hypothetical protein MJ215_05115 [Spirochaetia bacterium]|nr:hypothetical protein [Spirochaetia bacterium]